MLIIAGIGFFWSSPLLWFLMIRPYAVRHGKGYTTGATVGLTMWVNWQEAGEIAKKRGDRWMVVLCRIFMGLQIIVLLLVFASVFLA